SEVIEAMSVAFEDACRTLGLAQRDDRLRDIVAHKVIELAEAGERDPLRLRDHVLASFGKEPQNGGAPREAPFGC
ncbi:MAG TPA: hypothetical protein VIY07_06475, partial [Pseudolabrys sp.]